MANGGKSGRGLFGLGARPALAESRSPASERAIGAASPESLIEETLSLNQRALTGALAAGPLPAPETAALRVVGMPSRAPRLTDVRSGWFAYWVEQLRCAVRPHRKLWEYAVVLQALYEAGALAGGARALGFGVGGEPIPSYLASLGLKVVATDLPDAAERDHVLNDAFVAADAFDDRVEVSNLDMRRLDDETLRGFDACWSCSVLNEMRTVEEAFDTAILAMDVLRPGGVAVHTLDFAFADDQAFPSHGELAFTRDVLTRLAEGLNGRGHQVRPLSFDLGDHPLDGYVDLEPYRVEGADAWSGLWREGLGAPHLKLVQFGLRRTSFALIARART